MPINIEEIQAQLPELAFRLRIGSTVIIDKDDQPYLKLAVQAMPPSGPRNLEHLKGAFHISDAAIDDLFLSPAPARTILC